MIVSLIENLGRRVARLPSGVGRASRRANRARRGQLLGTVIPHALGDASVPFSFDVHAIIFAQDAPALENKLHKEFAHRRVNMVNHRKEYFRCTLDDIRVAVEKHHGLVTFVLTPEAEEWRKTRALLEASPQSGAGS
jgi:hypothetical protein